MHKLLLCIIPLNGAQIYYTIYWEQVFFTFLFVFIKMANIVHIEKGNEKRQLIKYYIHRQTRYICERRRQQTNHNINRIQIQRIDLVKTKNCNVKALQITEYLILIDSDATINCQVEAKKISSPYHLIAFISHLLNYNGVCVWNWATEVVNEWIWYFYCFVC